MKPGRAPRFRLPAIAISIVAGVATHSRTTEAQDLGACIASHEQAQVLRRKGKFLEAREQLTICLHPTCPSVASAQCGEWLKDLEQSMPSVAIDAVGPGGQPTFDVRVTLDDKLLVDRLQGTAIAINPGLHQFRFETSGAPPVDQRVAVVEGEKNKRITVRFLRSPPSAAPLASNGTTVSDEEVPPLRIAGYAMGGLGILALSGFGVLGAIGLSREGELRDSGCQGRNDCNTADIDAAKSMYTAADISLGGGIVLLGVGTALVLLSPSPKRAAARLEVLSGAGGGSARFVGHF